MSDPTGGMAPGTPKRSGRGVKIALALSLAVNLLILGLVGGAVLGVGPRAGGDDDPGLRTLGLGPFAIALSREDREAVTERIDREALRAGRRALGDSFGQLRAALLADPFDRVAAEAALTRSRVAAGEVQGHGHRALLDQIETMSAADRADLSERLGRALRRLSGRDRDRDRER
jgi:hypothetical protein